MSSRVEKYWVNLLDNNDNLLQTINGTSQGSLTWDYNQPVQKAGKIRIIEDGSINWLAHRLQIWYQQDDEAPWSLGIYVITNPTFINRVDNYEFPLELHDKTQIYMSDKLEKEWFITRTGASITESIEALIESSGETKINITHSPQQAQELMVWESGTPKLTVINALLKYINYKPLSTDGYGIFQVVPHNPPNDQPLAKTFTRGKGAIHSGLWSLGRDLSEIPNRVILNSSGSGALEGLQGIASNTDPNSPSSIPVMGRVVAHTEQVDAESQNTINSLAERRLQELSSPYGIINIEHLMYPLHLGDKVRLESGRVDFIGTVDRMDFTLTPGSLISATWRRIND